jgi:hypothetical protein
MGTRKWTEDAKTETVDSGRSMADLPEADSFQAGREVDLATACIRPANGERINTMSILNCDRQGCENVMCDRVVMKHTRICDDCYRELLQWRRTWPMELSAVDIRFRVESFFRTSPGSMIVLRGTDIEDEFRRLVYGQKED